MTDTPNQPDWPYLENGTGLWSRVGVMSNYDRTVNHEVADRLRQGGCLAEHYAWNFCGAVWFADGRWHEVVRVHHQPAGAYSADTLEELMSIVSDIHGWE